MEPTHFVAIAEVIAYLLGFTWAVFTCFHLLTGWYLKHLLGRADSLSRIIFSEYVSYRTPMLLKDKFLWPWTPSPSELSSHPASVRLLFLATRSTATIATACLVTALSIVAICAAYKAWRR